VVGATDLPPVFRALELPGRINAGKPAEISTGTVDGTLSYDLDGDGAFDDAEGATATGLDGERLVGVMAVDAGGDVGLSYRRLSPGPPPVEFIPVPTPAPPADPELRATVEIPAIKLAALRSRGLRLNVRCTVTCHSTVVLTVDKQTAKRLGLGKKLEIGRGSGKGPAITVKLNAKARKALAKARSLKLKATVRTTRVGPYKPVVTVKTVSASR
jgi:hypothetical protein